MKLFPDINNNQRPAVVRIQLKIYDWPKYFKINGLKPNVVVNNDMKYIFGNQFKS